MLSLLILALVITVIIFICTKFFKWLTKVDNDLHSGPNYTGYGCGEDFSHRYDEDEKDPWSMFREKK